MKLKAKNKGRYLNTILDGHTSKSIHLGHGMFDIISTVWSSSTWSTSIWRRHPGFLRFKQNPVADQCYLSEIRLRFHPNWPKFIKIVGVMASTLMNSFKKNSARNVTSKLGERQTQRKCKVVQIEFINQRDNKLRKIFPF